MRVLALIVGLVTGLGGFAFAYFVFVMAMFALGQSAGHLGLPMIILMALAPFIGTIGAILGYWKPDKGRTFLLISAACWVVLAMLLAYVRWNDSSKDPLDLSRALAIIGIVSVPALLSLIAAWLTTRAAARQSA
jgi:hypothetical protein